MVVDYREAHQAIAAQKLLAGAGIIAVYIPDKVVRVSEDETLTVWLVQRLKIPRADAARAAALLKDHDLRGEPLGTEWN
jgi:hypothetical protein